MIGDNRAVTRKILIVEDNLQNMSLVEMTLRDGRYALIKATDGEKAMAIAVKDKPDLIIMDIQLPKLSGLEVTKRLRQMPALSQIPIIAVTAYAMRGDKEKVIDAGCDAYLPKPINTRELRRLVAEMLSQRQKGNTNFNGDGDGY
jgi:two-component system cell cycle response regulator DivK